MELGQEEGSTKIWCKRYKKFWPIVSLIPKTCTSYTQMENEET